MSDLEIESPHVIVEGSSRTSAAGVVGSAAQGVHGAKLAQQIMERQKRLERQRDARDAVWDDVDEYITARRARYDIGTKRGGDEDKAPGESIYDGTATLALEDFCNGWQSQSANSLVKWWGARFRNQQLRKLNDANRWLDLVEEILAFEMASSNVYEQINEAYQDGATHGNATMVGPEWNASKNRFFVLERHPREIFFAVDYRGEVDLWHRQFVLTGRQILAQFGTENLTEQLLADIKRNPYRQPTCIHSIFRREERDVTSPLRTDLPWASVYVLPQYKLVLDEGGYTDMEVPITWRWSADSSYPYGWGAADRAIWDVMGTNAAMKSLLHAAQLAVNPAYITTENMAGNVDIQPGGEIVLKNAATDKVAAFQYPSQFTVGVQQISDLRAELRQRFKANIFQLQSQMGGKITAFQANLIQGEISAALIPITTRASSQLLVPLVNRFFHAAVKNGRIPPPPPSVMQYASSPVDIEMLGPMAVAAKRYLSQQGLTAFLGMLGELDKIAPNVAQAISKTINPDELRKYVTDGDGTPQKIFFTDKEIAAMRQAEAEMVKQQQKQQMLSQIADAYNKTQQAPQPGSGASQIVGSGR